MNAVKKKHLYLCIAAAALAVLVIFLLTRAGAGGYYDKYAGYDLSAPSGAGRSNTYALYLAGHADAAFPRETVDIDPLSYNKETSSGVTVIEKYEGPGDALITDETSVVEFTVNVPAAGFYNLKADYYPIEARGIDIERAVYINGEIPFLGSEIITFYRVWSDAPGGIKHDNQNNEIRPSQVENPRWQNSYFMDSQGYVVEPYRYYFEAGENTIKLTAVNEPMAIRGLTLVPVREIKSYEDYIEGYDLSLYQGNKADEPIKIQGESAALRSSPSLYAFFDTSSGTTEPNSVYTIKLNAIGGERWGVPGQWIEWNVDVPEDGLYRVSFKARQNYNRGMVSNRTLYIDGEIPCREALAIPFFYDNNWQLVTPEDAGGEELYFPLTKGRHTIRLQVSLGELSEILSRIEESMYRLNQIYLQVLVLTGADPDPNRDYRVNEFYPDIMDSIDFECRYIYKIIDDLVLYSGQMGPECASLQAVAKQLEMFVNKPQNIPRYMVNFKENIAGVGSSLVALNSASLDVDWIAVSEKNAKALKVNETFLISAKHEIESFIATFFIDYNNLGNVYTDRDITEVWIFSGRDQSTILKTMIDDTYTPVSGNPVNLKLVGVEALMPAVVAGTGPDVALTLMNADPINYAFRNAAQDLSKFDGFSETISEFYPSALVPFKYKDGIYGLPETQLYNVMFYRIDIFEDLGIKPPQTWQDLIAIFPVLQKKNMSIGMPSVERKINNIVNPDLSNFFAQLYQRGGALYNEDGSRCLLDGEQAVAAFDFYTRFFTHYKAPLYYDFVNRFRSGEMPIGFVDYNTFNTLAVFAPEIKGLWEFTVLPGTLMEDGTINRSTSCWGNACMMLSEADNPNRAWDFMKWWVSSDTQIRFGRELESVMGSSARYPTANKAAFESIAWNAHDSDVLKQQWEWVVGMPEVPGGYYSGRHIVNAVRRVINSKEDVRETLIEYTRGINDELTKKRTEFGLKVAGE